MGAHPLGALQKVALQVCGGGDPRDEDDGGVRRVLVDALQSAQSGARQEVIFGTNLVRSAKYTALTFLPINMFEQFTRTANQYFLTIATLQLIPGLSPTHWFTTVMPLGVVLTVNAVKEIYDDYWRHKSDSEVNARTVAVIGAQGSETLVTWRDVKVGMLLRVERDHEIPADLVLLSSTEPNSLAYVETANLDGETNLKVKNAIAPPPSYANDSMRGGVAASTPTPSRSEGAPDAATPTTTPRSPGTDGSVDGDYAAIEARLLAETFADSVITAEAPNPRLYEFDGNIAYADEDAESPAGGGVELATPGTWGASHSRGGGVDGRVDGGVDGGEEGRGEGAATGPGSDGSSTARSAREVRVDIQRTASGASLDSATLAPTVAPIVADNVLLRGATLRKVDAVYGVVIYTGRDTRLMRNEEAAPRKVSQLERHMNIMVPVVFSLQLFFCLVGALASHGWWVTSSRGHEYLGTQADTWPEYRAGGMGILTQTLRFVILMAQLIPISLYISLECVKVGQCYFIMRDLGMYHEDTDTPAQCRTTNLNEELGCIRTILSDKTGTLTQNVMAFVGASVRGERHGEGTESHAASGFAGPAEGGVGEIHTVARDGAVKQLVLSCMPELVRTRTLPADGRRESEGRGGIVTTGAAEPEADVPQPPADGREPSAAEGGADDRVAPMQLDAREEGVRRFLECLALCNTVVPSVGANGELTYQATSPDEEALVMGAAECGCRLVSRTPDIAVIRWEGDSAKGHEGAFIDEVFDMLAVLEFSSDRRRMSTVCRSRSTGEVIVYCKGADSVIMERLGPDQECVGATQDHLVAYARLGLRTLCVGRRVLPQAEWTEWSRDFQQASIAIEDRAGKVAVCAAQIEGGLELLGATAVEDKLQEGVPETIDAMRHAGVQVWMLTGDKLETAISIALTCNLLQEWMKLLIVREEDVAEDPADALRQLLDEATQAATIASGKAIAGHGTPEVEGAPPSVIAKKATPPPSPAKPPLSPAKPPQAPVGGDGESERAASEGGVSRTSSMGSFVEYETEGQVGLLDRLSTHPVEHLAPLSPVTPEPAYKAGSHLLDEDVRGGENGEKAPPGQAPCGLVIEGAAVQHVLSPEARQLFYELCQRCEGVVCCRVSPLEKAAITTLVKDSMPQGEATLAIGDGANDVPMIKHADVGVGISGREGMSAVLASDFALAQFSFLQRLLLVHGRQSQRRNADLVCYAFYKNIVYVMANFYYACYSAFSAQAFYPAALISTYNMLWTSLPTIAVAIFDKDVSDEAVLAAPSLYRGVRETAKRGLYMRTFATWLLDAFWHSLVVYYVPFAVYAGVVASDNGTQAGGVTLLGVVTYTICITVVNVRIGMIVCQWSWPQHVTIYLISVVLWFPFLYGCSWLFGAQQRFPHIAGMWAYIETSDPFVLVYLMGVVASLLPDVLYVGAQRLLRPGDVGVVQEIEQGPACGAGDETAVKEECYESTVASTPAPGREVAPVDGAAATDEVETPKGLPTGDMRAWPSIDSRTRLAPLPPIPTHITPVRITPVRSFPLHRRMPSMPMPSPSTYRNGSLDDTELGPSRFRTELTRRRSSAHSAGEGSDPDSLAALNALWRRETVLDVLRKQSGAITPGEAKQMARAYNFLSPIKPAGRRTHRRVRTEAHFNFDPDAKVPVRDRALAEATRSRRGSHRRALSDGSAHRRSFSAPDDASFNLASLNPLDLLPSITETSLRGAASGDGGELSRQASVLSTADSRSASRSGSQRRRTSIDQGQLPSSRSNSIVVGDDNVEAAEGAATAADRDG